jgi:hypothetical protein
MAQNDTLFSGDNLEPGQELIPPSGHYSLKYQTDGNLVIYVGGKNPIWSTGTSGKPAWKTCMQEDGNFVVYSSEGKPVWASNTYGTGGNRITIQDDGNLVIYNPQNSATWASRNTESEGSYDTHFTAENQTLLRDLNLLDVTLQKTDNDVESVNIEWGQVDRALFGCEEPYKECIYKMDGSDSHVKVFVADACGEPPAEFNTSGVNQNGGRLYFGYVYADDDERVKAIFFVIHPPDRKPFQRRFRTTFMLALLHTAVETGFARASGAVIGAAVGSIVPVVGTAIGGAIGYFAGEISSATFDSMYGDYLRYIG